MNRRSLLTALLGFFSIIIINWSCTKLDTTNLGGDLLPVVDNVNTFSNTMDVLAYQGVLADTTSLTRLEDHVLGKISSDPDFGTTDARIYVQLKPLYFPYTFTSQTIDTVVGVDSIILCLAYRGAWGDTSVATPAQPISVSEIPSTTGGEWDSLFKTHYITYQPIPDNSGTLLGSALVHPKQFADKIFFAHGKDSVTGQLRIKLSQAYVDKLAGQDSAKAGPRPGYIGNAFASDSIFRAKFKGLAIEPSVGSTGQVLMSFSLNDANTRLEVHFRKKRGTTLDTTYTALKLQGSPIMAVAPSATANKIKRDRTAATTVSYPAAGTIDPAPKNEIYLQTTPGTFTEVSIPGLNIFKDTNRIIHRAQLRITQIPDPGPIDEKFTPPGFLYLDLRDTPTTIIRHKPIYLDLNPALFYYPDQNTNYFPVGSAGYAVEYGYFGGYGKKKIDPISSSEITYFDFNITRYVQQMVTKHGYNYALRVFAPYNFSYPQHAPALINYPNNLADGRVKVGGTNGNYKMQVEIIWSKIKTP